MPDTPFFPAWRGRWHRRPRGEFPALLASLRRCTLDKLEVRFGPLLAGVAELSAAKASARERPYSVRRTWWCLLYQMLQLNTSCRDVVRQLQAMFLLEGRAAPDAGTSAYCQARARLPLPLLETLLHVSAQAADQRVAPSAFLQGRVVKGVDGVVLTLPDTPENQKAYPQPTSQKPGCGFPLLHLVVVWSARGGGVLDLAHGDYHHGEMRLLHQLGPTLAANDIVIYDRAAGHYVACAWLQTRQADLISRVSIRQIDWRRGQRLGPNERLVRWQKSRQKPSYLTAAEWAALPAEITVRVLRIRIEQPGFRTRQLVLVTTLLDAVAYPAQEIAAAYLRRWRLEMCLDDLKTTLGLDALRCKTPALVQRELLALLIAHNLVRAVMAEAARTHTVPLERLSFTGTLDTLRTFCAASAQASLPALARRLWAKMLQIIAADQVPLRPNRHEPRVVKRRPKPYPKLNRPRHEYRETRHGSRFRIEKT
ncbi:MAG TPA: IS4 family transposase [Steroidobacteraceae bacterium]|nr:IS4 family transposase [Steroidobacteraceae bacterium]